MESIDYDGLMQANAVRVFSERDPKLPDMTRISKSMN
jgi:hypothetical protein